MATRTLTQEEYDQFRQFLEENSGIVLGDNKQYLVCSRLHKLLEEQSFENLFWLVEKARKSGSKMLRQQILDAMTTNETLWFRDNYPFTILKKIVDEFSEASLAKHHHIAIWSAACSSGQEPYSISMTIAEALEERHMKPGQLVRVTGTDISQTVLEQAQLGVYNSLSLSRGLSEQRREKFFDAIGDGSWRIKDDIREAIRFRALNLKDDYRPLGKFHVIFCRNVLIYFSSDLKSDIVNRMSDCLLPGGYLFLGASESITGLSEKFEMINHKPGIIYRKRPE